MRLYPVWLSAEVQARIKQPLIPLINKETENVSECDIIKINMHWDLSNANSETYELKIATFENGQRE